MITQKSGKYYVIINYKSISGKWKKKWYQAGTGIREAERLEHRLIVARDSGESILDRNTAPTIHEFLDQWLDTSIKPPSHALGTYENYKYCCTKINKYIGNVRIDNLKAFALTKMYKKMMNDGLSASSVRIIYRVLRTALNKAVKWDIIFKNPVLSSDAPKNTESPAQAYDQNQAILLLRQSEKMGILYNLIISLGMLCGLRGSESCGLRWQDYDKNAEKLFIRHNLCRRDMTGFDTTAYEYCEKAGKSWHVLDTVKTKASENTIKLPEYVCELLDKRKLQYETYHLKLGQAYHDDNFILSNDIGIPYDVHYIYFVVHKVINTYNNAHPDDLLPVIRAHDLRHTAATLLLESNIDIKYVSRQLRHSSTTITQNLYQHVTDRMASITADAMEKIARPEKKDANLSTAVSTANH